MCTQPLFHGDVFQPWVCFFHEGVPVCFSVQTHDAVGMGNVHPATLEGKVKDGWWKTWACLSDIK